MYARASLHDFENSYIYSTSMLVFYTLFEQVKIVSSPQKHSAKKNREEELSQVIPTISTTPIKSGHPSRSVSTEKKHHTSPLVHALGCCAVPISITIEHQFCSGSLVQSLPSPFLLLLLFSLTKGRKYQVGNRGALLNWIWYIPERWTPYPSQLFI